MPRTLLVVRQKKDELFLTSSADGPAVPLENCSFDDCCAAVIPLQPFEIQLEMTYHQYPDWQI